MNRDIIVLSDLQIGMPGISPVEGAFLQENAVVALHNAGHHSLTTTALFGIAEKDVDLKWDNDSVTEQMKASYNDEQENVEFAAMGISALLTPYLTEYTIIMRAKRVLGSTIGLEARKPLSHQKLHWKYQELNLSARTIL